jgi:hypothetical protein
MLRRRTPAAALLALVFAGPALAADCDGGSTLKLRLAGNRARFDGTVTRAGTTHDTFVGAGPFQLRVVKATDGALVYEADVPANHFVTRGRRTRYDHGDVFQGDVVLKNATGQADTVRIVLRAANTGLGAIPAADLRAFVTTGGGRCARTCVAPCSAAPDGVRCGRSDVYVPFADAGFGALARPSKRPQNPLCGLAIDTTKPCDFLIDERCILPYPSSYFLAADGSTPTGLRVNYGAQALPKNTGNVYIDPTDWNTLDGFSPGPVILSLFPDTGFPVDLTASNVAFHTNFARSLDADHPTVIMKAATGERVIHFAEMDANTTDVTKRALIIRPGRRLEDGTRYIVAIRNLVDTNGTPIRARLAFRALRDALPGTVVASACGASCAAAIAARQANFTGIMQTLQTNGVDPAELVLAWDFTTASTQALTGWIRSVRDQAFALGTPTFTVTSVDDGGGAGRNATIWAEIQGTFQAPLFMTADAPASRLNLVGGVPAQNGYATVPYVVEVPRAVYNGSGAAVAGRPSLWGHGLLGDRFQVRGLSAFANEYRFVMAGVDMQGMSSADVGPGVVPAIGDESKFHFIPERLHQGFLNHLLLGRLLVDPVNGFSSHPAFSFGGAPAIDTTEVYYSGGSQGGIFGVAIMSIAEDFKRGFLAVPGANYSTLLHRSIDFNPFLAISRGAYPDRLDEELVIALIQQLWDRAEPQGYMNHLAAGDLSSPPVPHKVLIHMSTCDAQVSNLGTQIMVRSLGIPQVTPVLRSFFDIPEMAAPYDGSAFVEIDWQKCGSRCNVPGQDDPGAACATDADCPGLGDPPSRTRCDSGVPPLSNTAPLFENGAHGAEGSASPLGPEAQQVDAFLRPAGDVEQFCTGPCDPN